MSKKQKIKHIINDEVVRKTNRNKTIYHYIDTQRGINCKSKEVFKNIDRIVVFPFFFNRDTHKIEPKSDKIKSYTYEGFRGKIPTGFYKEVFQGYGPTRYLGPIKAFIEKNFEIENITISKTKATKLSGHNLIINYLDFESLRKQVLSVIGQSREKNASLINNYFASVFPRRFESRKEKYQKGTIDRITKEYDAVERNLSADDRVVLLNLFDQLSEKKKGLFEKKELVITREKIEKRFIEDILKGFQRRLKQKTIKEERWQDFFKENSWIFSQLFSYPTVLFKDKAFVGGKTIEDTEGKIVDFLYANKLTRNSALIEIKKHTTKLLSKKPYRGLDVFNMDKELSGAISQVLDQKETFTKKYESIRGEDDIGAFNPRCIVVIGMVKDLNKKQLKSFELLRSSLKDVDIIAFDELYQRIESILKIFTRKKNEV